MDSTYKSVMRNVILDAIEVARKAKTAENDKDIANDHVAVLIKRLEQVSFKVIDLSEFAPVLQSLYDATWAQLPAQTRLTIGQIIAFRDLMAQFVPGDKVEIGDGDEK